MRALHEKWTSQQLKRLADVIAARPWLFIYPQIFLAIFCFAYSVTNLRFSVTRADLISEKVPYQKQYLEYKRNFQVPDALVAVVESESPEKNLRFMERLASRVSQEPKLFQNTYFKGDLQTMGPKGLLFLPEDTLEELQRTLDQAWPVIEEFSRAESLDAVFGLVNRRFREGGEGEMSPEEVGRMLPMLTVLRRLLEEAARSVRQPLADSFPGLVALFGDHSKLYLTFGGGDIYALVTHAAGPDVEAEAVERLREIVRQTGSEVTGVNSGISGEPVLNHDEMIQARSDIVVASVISASLVALIFIFGFHEVKRPLLATLCLAVGIAYSLAFGTAAVGRLNILSITLVPILIGLSIDFGVHLISRYEEELRSGRSAAFAMRTALALTGTGVFTGAFTTAAAFFAMMLTDFKGLQEMGFLSGAGLLLCLTPMMTMLPALLIRGTPVAPEIKSRHRSRCTRQMIEELWLKRPRLIIFGAVVLTVGLLSQVPRLRFDYNLLNLQTEGLPAVGIEEKLIRTGAESLLQGLVIADSLDEAAELERKLESLDVVSRVSSMVDYLTEDQTRKVQLVREIKAMAEGLELPAPPTRKVDAAALNSTLFSLQGYLGLALDRLQKTEGISAAVLREIEMLRNAVVQLRTYLGEPTSRTVAHLTEFERAVFANVAETVELIRNQDAREGLRLEDLPPFLSERFISTSGKYLLQVHPKGDVWLRENQKEFIAAVRTVAPNVTGTVVQIYEFTSLLKNNFVRSGVYSALLITLVLLVHFRQPGPALLTLLPVILGLSWLFGVMASFNIAFNPVNSMAPTLLIGIGIANAVHIVNRFAEHPSAAILSRSTGKAVLVSAVTTMVGFGALMVAKHQGIESLGAVMAIGTGTCLVAPLVLLPALLTFWKPVKRQVHQGTKRSSERA